jgi:hypothetical protein
VLLNLASAVTTWNLYEFFKKFGEILLTKIIRHRCLGVIQFQKRPVLSLKSLIFHLPQFWGHKARVIILYATSHPQRFSRLISLDRNVLYLADVPKDLHSHFALTDFCKKYALVKILKVVDLFSKQKIQKKQWIICKNQNDAYKLMKIFHQFKIKAKFAIKPKQEVLINGNLYCVVFPITSYTRSTDVIPSLGFQDIKNKENNKGSLIDSLPIYFQTDPEVLKSQFPFPVKMKMLTNILSPA